MASKYPEVYLVRHGETEWALSGRHTGRSDIPLTAAGEAAARLVPGRLPDRPFAAVWSSPSQRAMRTCVLAGFETARVVDPDLAEWDYGAYEGRTTKEIQAERPDWRLFRDACPNGESAADVGARADAVIGRIRDVAATLLIFSSAHFLRVLGARWLGLPPEAGAQFVLDTTSISVLGYEHDLTEPVIRRWNQQ
jgi:probable phosphoglycerate mutase